MGSDRVDLGRLEACLHIVQSTSPSYLLMTSLDAARYELALHGEEMLQRGLALAQMAREAMKKIPGITCVGEASRGKAIYNLDLVRLVISARILDFPVISWQTAFMRNTRSVWNWQMIDMWLLL